jgi:hypothetical protein
MKAVLCVLAAVAMCAQAQTQPAARDLPTVSADVLAAVAGVKNHASVLLKELDKPQPDRQAVQAQAAEAVEIGRAHVELQSLAYLVCRLLLEKKK